MIRHSLINRENWDDIAVISDDKRYSYRDLALKAIAVYEKLPQNATGNIAIYLPDGVGYVAALYGIIMAGMTAFPLSVRLTSHEVSPLLEQVSARAVITSRAYSSLFEGMGIQVIYAEDLTKPLKCVISPARQAVSEDAPMLLLATSGTTGNSKIVMLSEKNVSSSTLSYISKMDFEKIPPSEIRLALGTPFCSVYGLMVLTACVIKSITVVALKDGFTLDALYKSAEKYKLTHFEGGVSVGLMMERLAGRPISYDISSFRYFGLAGSKISADTLKRLTTAYPDIEFWTGYGMTEAGPLIAKPCKRVNMDKLDSVGTIADCAAVMVSVDGRLTDEPFEKGEIVVKGSGIMLGYYNNEEETRKILKDGFLYTGDIGYLDGDGYLYICGRKKNIIIVRGFNVHAEEVECCIQNSGLATDCVVYGETGDSLNETVCADIVPASPHITIDEIRVYLKSRLADYKQPQRIFFVDGIDKTTTGKTQRAGKNAPWK